MYRTFLGALAASAALICCAPANATVFYSLNFENASGAIVSEGTGTLGLNLTTLAQANNFNSSNISSFNSLTTTVIHNQTSFSLLPADLLTFSISTGNVGQVFSLTVQEIVPASNFGNPATATSILVLDLFTNTWQIHGQNNSTVDQGRLAITGPSLTGGGTASATPLPAALPLFAGGAGVLGLFGWRRNKKAAAAA
jgi:hypothetical protein